MSGDGSRVVGTVRVVGAVGARGSWEGGGGGEGGVGGEGAGEGSADALAACKYCLSTFFAPKK